MSVLNTISPDKLVRLVGIPTGPVLIDVRPEEEFSAEPLLILDRCEGPPAMSAPGHEHSTASRSLLLVGTVDR
jgi:rhodanese-related sulfurtransferase